MHTRTHTVQTLARRSSRIGFLLGRRTEEFSKHAVESPADQDQNEDRSGAPEDVGEEGGVKRRPPDFILPENPEPVGHPVPGSMGHDGGKDDGDRKSTRLTSSKISLS